MQLQQVLMNLMLNSIDAMKDVDGTRELAIKSERAERRATPDLGQRYRRGAPAAAARIRSSMRSLQPSLTAPAWDFGISRSIVESHGGRLWAADNSPRGASFYLTLPTKAEAHE